MARRVFHDPLDHTGTFIKRHISQTGKCLLRIVVMRPIHKFQSQMKIDDHLQINHVGENK